MSIEIRISVKSGINKKKEDPLEENALNSECTSAEQRRYMLLVFESIGPFSKRFKVSGSISRRGSTCFEPFFLPHRHRGLRGCRSLSVRIKIAIELARCCCAIE